MAISHLMRLIKVGGGLGNTRSASLLLKNYASITTFDIITSDPFLSGDGSVKRSPPVNLGICIVRENNAIIVERFGRYRSTLGSGIHCLIPVVDRIRHAVSLETVVMHLPDQSAVTADQVKVVIKAVLALKIKDPKRVAYGANNPVHEVAYIAQAVLMKELFKVSFEKAIGEMPTLKNRILEEIEGPANDWGLQCVCFHIDKISPAKVKIQDPVLKSEDAAFSYQFNNKMRGKVEAAIAILEEIKEAMKDCAQVGHDSSGDDKDGAQVGHKEGHSGANIAIGSLPKPNRPNSDQI